jgi:hypothetical protein
MKKLVLGSLVAGLSLAAGCTVVEETAVTVSWDLRQGVDSTPATACPPGATTARVFFDGLSGPDYDSTYDCVAGTGVEFVEAGDYNVTIDLTDDSVSTIYAGSDSIPITVVDGIEGSVTASINIDSGFFFMSWSFAPAGENCASAGSDGVDLLATIADTTTALDTILPCTDGEGLTDGVPLFDATGAPAGGYVIQVSLLSGNQVQGSSDPRPVRAFEFANEVQDVGNFEFAVAPGKMVAGR